MDDGMRRDGMGAGGSMPGRGPGDVMRAGGLAVALAAYGLFGAPAPPGIGLAEVAVAGGLACALGVIRPICVGSGLMLIAPSARLHEVVGTAAFLYLLWVPLLGAAFAGAAPEDVVRDIVPLGFLFLPVLLAPAGPLAGRLRHPGRAGQHAARSSVNLNQAHALGRQYKLTDLIGVTHAASLQNVEHTVALAISLDHTKGHPCVHQGGKPVLAVSGPVIPCAEICEDRRDAS